MGEETKYIYRVRFHTSCGMIWSQAGHYDSHAAARMAIERLIDSEPYWTSTETGYVRLSAVEAITVKAVTVD